MLSEMFTMEGLLKGAAVGAVGGLFIWLGQRSENPVARWIANLADALAGVGLAVLLMIVVGIMLAG